VTVRRRFRLLASFALAAAVLAACSSVADGVGRGLAGSASSSPRVTPGGDGVESPTPDPSTSPGAPSSPGATTSPSGSVAAPVVRGTFRGTIDAGAATMTLSGYSCDVADGAWTGTVVVSGSGSGTTSFDLSVPSGKEGAKVSWSIDGTSDGSPATWKIDGHVFEGGTADAPELLLFGTTTLVQGDEETHAPARATAPVTLGPVAECG
jgi:hypothetical protein